MNAKIEPVQVEQTEGAAVDPRAKPRRTRAAIPWGSYLVRTLAIVGAVLLWQAASVTKFNFIVNFENVPAPLLVAEHLVQQLTTKQLYMHIGVSVRRVLIAFSLATG